MAETCPSWEREALVKERQRIDSGSSIVRQKDDIKIK